MLSSTTIKAFKMLHWVATFTMAIVIAGYCYFQHIQRLTVSDKLYEVRQLTPRTWLLDWPHESPDSWYHLS